MTKTASLNSRLNPEVKKTAETVYAQYGLSLAEAVTVFIHQSCNIGGILLYLHCSCTYTDAIRLAQRFEFLGRGYI